MSQASVQPSPSPAPSAVTYNRPVCALEDAANFNIRHPLQSKWTLWYRASSKNAGGASSAKSGAKADNWEASLQCVNTVDTIEDFWGMYNNVPGIGRMEENSDYMFFKEGIRPAWEDPANASGGSFTLQFKGVACGEFLWLNTLITAVGSALTHCDKVTGVFFAKRGGRPDRISLWLSTTDRDVCRQVEQEWIGSLQEVNGEEFNWGSVSFTYHKSGGSSHREKDRERSNADRDAPGAVRRSGSEYHSSRDRASDASRPSFDRSNSMNRRDSPESSSSRPYGSGASSSAASNGRWASGSRPAPPGGYRNPGTSADRPAARQP